MSRPELLFLPTAGSLHCNIGMKFERIFLLFKDSRHMPLTSTSVSPLSTESHACAGSQQVCCEHALDVESGKARMFWRLQLFG